MVASLTSAIALLLLAAAVVSTLAAVKFDKLADDNAALAGDRKAALDDAESNLALAPSRSSRRRRISNWQPPNKSEPRGTWTWR